MTQGKKKMLMAAILLVIMLAAFWVYMALAGRQNENLGYMVRKDRSCPEAAMAYEKWPEAKEEEKDG